MRQAWEATGASLITPASADGVTKIEEDITSAYFMLVSNHWGSAVYGVRVEQTDYTSSGTIINDETGLEEPIIQ